MIDNLFITLYDAMEGAAWLALAASFGWGLLSILLSPCHLSSIPLVVGYISAQKGNTVKKTFLIAVVFSSGILLTILLIGFITALLGRMLGDIGKIGNYLVAGIFILVGLYLLGIINPDWDRLGLRETRLRGLPAAFLLGLIFGLGVGPCTFAFMAPVLGVVFQTAQTSVFYASALLASFAFGHCILIILAGVMAGRVQVYLNWTESSKALVVIKRVCGALVILGGIYLALQ